MSSWRACLLGLALLSTGAVANAARQVNPETGLSSWKRQEQGFSLELVQVLPDYVRAVYASRGLPQAIIDRVSAYCVFGTILRNRSDRPLSYNRVNLNESAQTEVDNDLMIAVMTAQAEGSDAAAPADEVNPLMKKVMASCTSAGYGKISLAVIQKAKSKG